MNSSPKLFQQKALNWYKKYGRKDLPWQKNTTPYKTWLSEIMLQQTQVATVIPYFKKFLKQFPNIKTLAAANIDDVLHLWAGLGYYARARNLHKCAQIITEDHEGKFPKSVEALCELPGIGRSTAGAILALSMQQRAAILDGNVKRVLARVFCVEGYPNSTQTQKRLWHLAETHTPSKKIESYTQAMMDLGAMVCTRTKPKCDLCPLQKLCQAHKESRETEFPHRKIKKTLPVKSTYMLVLKNSSGEILLVKRPPTGIWGGLWSFPECEQKSQLSQILKNQFGYKTKSQQPLTNFRHTFSHYHLEITPILMEVENSGDQVMENKAITWYKTSSTKKIGLPQPIRKILEENDL